METYAVVRAHGIKSRLLSKQDYQALVAGTKQIWEFPDYAYISEQDPLEKKLEKVYKVYIDRIAPLTKIPKVSDLTFTFLDRLEVENIKFHLRFIAGYQRPVLYYPYGRLLGLEKLRSLGSEVSIWEALSDTPLKAPKTPGFTTGLIAEREALLEILYYRYLTSIITNLKWRKDIIAALMDLVSSDFTVRYVYWVKLLSENTVHYLIESYAPELKVQSELLESLEGTSTTEILQKGTRMLVSRVLKGIRTHPLDPAYIYILNHLLLIEAQNLEKILLGKELRIPEKVILSNLILL